MWHYLDMTFRSGADFGGKEARSGGGGGGIAIGGGVGSIVLVGLFLLLGGNPSDLGAFLGNEQSQSDGAAQGDSPECKTAEDGNTKDECLVEFTGRSVDNVWSKVLPEQANIQYTEPERVVFHGGVNTGCGAASSSTGPFYCPRDESAYFDTAFFDSLRNFGAENAPLARMYIVAHEFGHHIQNLEGTLGLSDYDNPGADSNAVKIELQADCYAGLWASYADKGDNPLLEPITKEQVSDAVAAAQAVGDDNIQRRSGGQVQPDSWTHGSSEQREKAFLAGYNSGKMSQCDTLGRGAYRG